MLHSAGLRSGQVAMALPAQEQKHAFVHAQFERIAAKYDLTNDVISFGMHRLWKECAVQALLKNYTGSKNRAYLDVCCGTGDLSLRIAGKLTKEDSVTGLDFSGNMLGCAAQRLLKAGNIACNVNWIEGDAQNLPFQADQFDGAIISFGLRNLTDLQKGICEMTRVVKPGGLVLNLDLGEAQGPIFAPLFSIHFDMVVPLIGQILQNDRKAYTYLPESRTTYPKPQGITKIFSDAGLIDVKHIALAGGSVALHTGRVPG